MYMLDIHKAEKLEAAHWDYCNHYISKRIKDKIQDHNNPPEPNERQFYDWLLEQKGDIKVNLKQLITGKPDKLRQIYQEKIGEWAKSTAVKERLKKVFNYKTFTDKREVGIICELSDISYKNWSAYQLTYHLGVNVCCYCNRQYTNTLNINKKGYARPQLDHFYPKSNHPYFALSLYNLIPACSTCNASFKKDIDTLEQTDNGTYKDKYLNPYEKQMDDGIKFKRSCLNDTQLIDKSFQKVDPVQFQITLTNANNCSQSTNSLELFKIKEMYNLHKQEVADRINLLSAYNERAIYHALSQISGTEKQGVERRAKEISLSLRHGLKEHLLQHQPRRQILGKLLSDITEDEFK